MHVLCVTTGCRSTCAYAFCSNRCFMKRETSKFCIRFADTGFSYLSNLHFVTAKYVGGVVRAKCHFSETSSSFLKLCASCIPLYVYIHPLWETCTMLMYSTLCPIVIVCCLKNVFILGTRTLSFTTVSHTLDQRDLLALLFSLVRLSTANVNNMRRDTGATMIAI